MIDWGWDWDMVDWGLGMEDWGWDWDIEDWDTVDWDIEDWDMVDWVWDMVD